MHVLVRKTVSAMVFSVSTILVSAPSLVHADLPPDVAAKVESFKKKLVEWAANPALVAAVKAANDKGSLIPGMTNAKWDELDEKDPQVQQFSNSPAGKFVAQWEEENTGISKLYLRDEKGNLVASSKNKPLLWNNASKPPFVNALKGQPWNAAEIKPDPVSQVPGVHVSVPVLDGGKPIGVLHTSVVAK